MIWHFFIFIAHLTFLRNQLAKYFGLNIDWHIFFHIITVLLGIFLLIRLFIKGLVIKKIEYLFLLVISCFFFLGLFYRNNKLFVTYWGIFEYLYFFLWGYFLSFFVLKKTHLKLIFLNFKIAVFLMVGIAIYQGFEYLLFKFGIIPFMLFKNHPQEAIRLGFLRPPSLIGTPTEWGSVALIYFLLDLYLHNFKISKKNTIIIFSIIISLTRSLYVSFFFISLLLISFRKKYLLDKVSIEIQKIIKVRLNRFKLFLSWISILFFLFLFIYIIVYNQIDFVRKEGHARGYFLKIALSMNNKLLGLGPGMFGGYVSVKTKSPFLETYKSHLLSDIERLKVIDSYWLQVFIETGFLGLILNFLLFFSFYKIMLFYFKKIDNSNTILKSISFSCIFVPLIYAVNAISFPIFLPTYILWTSLLVGAVGSYTRYNL